jgi:hypothetical protein
MSNFGFISPLFLPERQPAWKCLTTLFPGWIHFYPAKPKAIGVITGSLFEKSVRGYGFRAPSLPAPAWNESRTAIFWNRFCQELQRREVAVLGLDQETPQPPTDLIDLPDFPGISDGKALELFLFNLNFHRILDLYEITPLKATATIIWEEGNQGLTCARLIGRELRFLTLVHPKLKVLEQAAEVISAETGLAPRTFTEIPANYRELGIVIHCGRTMNYPVPGGCQQRPRYHLFGAFPGLFGANLGLSVSMGNWQGDEMLYPALGEAVFRACGMVRSCRWSG